MQQSQAITRKSASNLALAFCLLPKSRRAAMSALYAFCREVDDVADEAAAPVEVRRAHLAQWRADIRRTCDGGSPELVVNRELQPVVQTFHLPYGLFDELIKGCEMDLDITRYESFAELEVYCHRVASVVGLLSIEIFGYRNRACREYAIHLGKALQLTNILRDVRVDADRGRIYLPLEELRRHAVTEAEILNHQYSERFSRLAAGVAGRAVHFYRRARATLPAEDRRSMIAAELMGLVYWRLLRKLTASGYNVLGPKPIRLSKPHKLALILGTWFRFVRGASTSSYGS